MAQKPFVHWGVRQRSSVVWDVYSVFLTRHVTSASINLVTRRITLASTSS